MKVLAIVMGVVAVQFASAKILTRSASVEEEAKAIRRLEQLFDANKGAQVVVEQSQPKLSVASLFGAKQQRQGGRGLHAQVGAQPPLKDTTANSDPQADSKQEGHVEPVQTPLDGTVQEDVQEDIHKADPSQDPKPITGVQEGEPIVDEYAQELTTEQTPEENPKVTVKKGETHDEGQVHETLEVDVNAQNKGEGEATQVNVETSTPNDGDESTKTVTEKEGEDKGAEKKPESATALRALAAALLLVTALSF